MDLRAGSISKSLGPSRAQSLLVTLGWLPPQSPTQGKLRWPFFFLSSSFKKNYACTKNQKSKPPKILLPRPQNTEHIRPVPTKQGTLGCKAFSALLPALFKSPLTNTFLTLLKEALCPRARVSVLVRGEGLWGGFSSQDNSLLAWEHLSPPQD